MQDAAYFKNLSDEALSFAINDIREAMEIIGQYDEMVYFKYEAQMAAALTEQVRRRSRDRCPTCNRPL